MHASVPSLEALLPYLDPVWHQFARERGWAGPRGAGIVYPPELPSSVRSEWRPEDASSAASRVDLLRSHVLDPWQVDHAILSCYYGLDYLRHPAWAAALTSALNDWLLAEWLAQDERLRGSVAVPARNAAAAVREIERVGAAPGFVQVLMPVRSHRPYGDEDWFPLYEAMVEHDLVFGLHRGGVSEGAPTPSGWPSWYVEELAGEVGAYISQIVSLVAGGVFQRFPRLRVSVLEIGFAWLPPWLWRLDKDWKSLRRETPWVSEPPSDLIRRHMRLSTSPVDAGSPAMLANAVEWLGSDELLMFSTDYPHMHDDDLAALLAAVPEESRAKVMVENARAWYGLA